MIMKGIKFYRNCIRVLWSNLFSVEWRAKEHIPTRAKRAKIETFAQVQTNVSPREERYRLIGLSDCRFVGAIVCRARIQRGTATRDLSNERLGQANAGRGARNVRDF